jgi:hypothetical protein
MAIVSKLKLTQNSTTEWGTITQPRFAQIGTIKLCVSQMRPYQVSVL